jgi:exosortase
VDAKARDREVRNLSKSRSHLVTLAVAGGVGLLYRDVLVKLVHDWATDGNSSHGFLIPPIAAYFAWERRHSFASADMRPSVTGLGVVLASIGVLACGVLGSELFLSRISLVGTLTGIVLFLFGWRRLRVMAFPLAFLLLMIPLPTIVLNQIAFPLQLLASQVGEFGLNVLKIPVLREGNVLVLPAISLEVAEACSGIRSLISLLTLAIVFGYFADPRAWSRTAIALSAIPVAVLANGVRVTSTGIAVEWLGPAAAEGFFHAMSGWLVFAVAVVLMIALQRLLSSLFPRPSLAGSFAGVPSS